MVKQYGISIEKLEEAIDLFNPNRDQRDALKGLRDWYDDWDTRDSEHKPAILSAFGGCGKSYLFSLFILETVRDLFYLGKIKFSDEFKVALIAPSNRAAEVMRDFSQSNNLWRFCKVTVTTVHAFSGMVMGDLDQDAEVEKTFISDRDLDFNLVIVDEYSMIDEFLFEKRLHNNHAFPILYCGNLEQLPPVKTALPTGTSIVNNHPHLEFTLSQVMRNRGKILEYSQQLLQQYSIADMSYSVLVENLVSNGVCSDFQESIHDYTKTVSLPFSTDDSLLVAQKDECIQHLCSKGILSADLLSRDNDYFKILCYTNSEVANWNAIVRKILFGEAHKTIHRGEPFLVKAPVYSMEDGKLSKAFFTNQYINLENIQFVQHGLIDPFDQSNTAIAFPGEKLVLDFWECSATSRYGAQKSFLYATPKTLAILSAFMVQWWKAIAGHTSDSYRKQSYNHWNEVLKYYGLRYKNDPALKVPFDRLIIPAYAATVHSFQGSTCENVLIDYADICTARSMDTKMRLMYVAASRAKKSLLICTNNEGV
jgi:UvrD-like helicase C-terminal domain/AAA domain